MKIFKFIILLLNVILLTSCNSVKTEKKINLNSNTVNVYSFGLGLTSDSAISDRNVTFKINKNSTFKGELDIENNMPFENEFKLIFLLDYTPVVVKFDENIIYNVTLKVEENSNKKVSVSLPEIKEGLHDLLIICVRNPKQIDTMKNYSAPEKEFLFKRATIIAGTDSTEQFKIHDMSSNINSISKDTKFNNLFISEIPTNEVNKALSKVSSDVKDKSYFVNIPISTLSSKLVLLTFINYEISDVSLLKIKHTGTVHYPFYSNANKKGNLFFVSVQNPFEKIEDDNKNLINIPWDATFSNKILMNK